MTEYWLSKTSYEKVLSLLGYWHTEQYGKHKTKQHPVGFFVRSVTRLEKIRENSIQAQKKWDALPMEEQAALLSSLG